MTLDVALAALAGVAATRTYIWAAGYSRPRLLDVEATRTNPDGSRESRASVLHEDGCPHIEEERRWTT